MRLFQTIDSSGKVRLGVLRSGRAQVAQGPHEGVSGVFDLLVQSVERDLPVVDWLASAEAAGVLQAVEWPGNLRLTVPLTPPEVWGAGVTYRRSADFREEGTGFYDRVYVAARPELFYKAAPRHCVGPGEPIGRRRDSTFTASEPELALVLARDGRILGYTLANDVSAWDIERDNPLYLPQSKIYTGCFSFGPVIVTPDEVKDPYALELVCRITRGGRLVFSGSASTGQLKRRFEEIVDWLGRSSSILTGTVLSTGTGIIQPMEIGLEEGDLVTISCPEIGDLGNPVALV